jgi:uncharacterized protein involved in exopolysaccharide biosynthesis
MAKRLQKSLPDERSVRNLLDPVHVGSPSLGIEYKQVVVETLGKLSRHKLLITAIVAAALVLGIIASLAIPKRYTAEAFIRELAASDSVTAARGTSGERPIAFDASLLVGTRAQLFQSHQLARQVVQRLGLERLRPIVRQGRLSTWLQREFYGIAMSAPEYQADMAATRLMQDLLVKTEPRVYQIVLRYSAKDPELATAVTNAFVVEFLRTTSLEKLSGQRAAAQAALSENLATLGEKHPKVREERMRLAGAESLIKEQLTKTPNEIQKSAGENITFAKASVIPSSPNPPFIIGLTLLAGLGVGIGLALRLERTPQLQRSQELELARDRGLRAFPVPLSANLHIASRVLRRRVALRWRRLSVLGILRQNG